MQTKRNPYLFPFLMVASLFFIWGFCHAMLDVLNKHFQNLLSLTKTQSGLIQTAFFIAYLLVAFPAAKLIRRVGYQKGILIGLVILAVGAFSFIPAGMVFKTFGAFLFSLFVLASGLAVIETAANPYVTVLGPKDGAAGRLSVAQAFNSCAYILAPTVGGFLLFGKEVDPKHPDFAPLLLPYVVLGGVVLLIFTVFSFVKLPVIEAGSLDENTGDDAIIKAPLSRLPHFKWGVFTQFLYIISQIGIGAFAVNYIVQNAIVKDAAGIESTSPLFTWYQNLTHAKTADATAAYVISFAFVLYAIGRFSGAVIAKVIKPNLMLAIYGVANSLILLVAMADIKMVSWVFLPFSFLFMSIMFPFIFALSIRNLGEQTKIAASFHVMAVGVAGSISAVAMGWLWDNFHSVTISFAVPLVGFMATTLYGLAYPKLLAKSEQAG
jgi:FHS family L-fucose permease-like MFS transporter